MTNALLRCVLLLLLTGIGGCADVTEDAHDDTFSDASAGMPASADVLGARVKETPQYGGTLNVGTVYVTLSPLSWDPVDWNWKLNHDTGMYYEQLFVGDLEKSERKGGNFPFRSSAYLPNDVIRGELAESWEWTAPLTLVVSLRRGVMFPAKPGVMESRELTAADVVFSYNRLNESPKRISTYFDHVQSVTQTDDHTVVFQFNEFNAEWNYRFGYGYYSAIVPREMANVNAKNWRNAVGTGPFQLTHYLQANSQTYTKTQDYWDREAIDGVKYKIPFVDQLKYRIIKDEATYLTALRSGKLDILEPVRWIAVDHLKKTTPELKWSRWLSSTGNFMVMRMDRKPFDDIRVRRALNLAVNQQEIVDLFYGGHAELMAYPQHPGFTGYFEPLESMPESVQELFSYNPERAKSLLAEAGYPDGFKFTVQVSTSSPNNMDLIPLLSDYLAKIGVEIEIEPLEYAAFLSAMTSRTHTAGYLMNSGHVNPTTTLRKSMGTGQTWNPAQFSDPEFDENIKRLHLLRDETERQALVKQMTIEMLDQAPYLWLPTQYLYTAWWPWVKNYGGEFSVGTARPGPIYARIWIDEKMKEEMGF